MLNGSENSGDVVVKKKKKKKLKLQDSNINKSTAATVSQPTVTSTVTSASISTTAVPVTTNTSASVVSSVKTTTVTSGVGEVSTSTKASSPEKLKEAFEAILQENMKDESSSHSGPDETSKGETSQDQKESAKPTQLPTQLPPALAEAIDSIKKEAKESKEGKSKFFSAEVNRLLLEIELGSRNLQCSFRTSVFNHLGEHLPCGKQAIMRRAKKLRESQQEDQLKGPIQKLKDAILKVMPTQIASHEAEVAKAKLTAGEEGGEATKEEASTESEGEDKAVDGKKKSKLPRRKFQYTDEIKALLLTVVSTKMKLFTTCKSRNETAEDYLKAFLEKDVKSIWPQGWMQTRMLFKESKSVHEEFTKATVKKAVLANRKAPSPTPDVSLSQSAEPLPQHISKTENVVEISNNRETVEGIKDVVVNLPNSGVKLPTVTSLPVSFPTAQSLTAQVSNALANASKSGKIATSLVKSPLVNNKINTSPATSRASTTAPAVSRPTQVVNQVNSSTKAVIQITDSPPIKNQTMNHTVIQITDSPPINRQAVPVTSSTGWPIKQNQNTAVKGTSLITGQQSPNANVTKPTSTSPSSQERSFLSVFEDFAGDRNTPILPGQQTSPRATVGQIKAPLALPRQPTKASATQFMKTAGQLAKASVSPQVKSTSPQRTKSPVHQSGKSFGSLSKPNLGGAYLKLAQDSKTNLPQKAAHSSTVVKKDYARAKSSWASVSSVSPTEKLVSPNVNRIPSTNTGKSPGEQNKTSHSLLLGMLPASQTIKSNPETIAPSGKSTHEQTHKKQTSAVDGLHLPTSTKSTDRNLYQSSNKFHSGNPSKSGSGSSTHHNSGSSKSIYNSGMHSPSSMMRVQPQVSPSLRQGSSSKGSVFYSNSSSPSLFPTASPGSGHDASLRRDSYSPKKSPASPNYAKLSLYEQIQSQIKSQEAMEGQALKNLALALGVQGRLNNLE